MTDGESYTSCIDTVDNIYNVETHIVRILKKCSRIIMDFQ